MANIKLPPVLSKRISDILREPDILDTFVNRIGLGSTMSYRFDFSTMPINDRRILMKRRLLHGIGYLWELKAERSVFQACVDISYIFSCGFSHMIGITDIDIVERRTIHLQNYLRERLFNISMNHFPFDEWTIVETYGLEKFCKNMDKEYRI